MHVRETISVKDYIIIDCVALAKQGDNALGSICLSVFLSVCLSVATLVAYRQIWNRE